MENNQQSQTSKSIFKSVLYGLSTWIVPLILSFIATPIILRSLGDKDYGIYALVLGFIAYSFNLSFGRAITKYVAEYRANGENEKISDIISATLLINLTVGIAVIIAIFAAANYLVADVFQIAAEDRSKTVFALYIASLTLFFLMLNQVFNSILQGIHRFDVYSKIINFNTVALICGNIVLALYGYGLTALLAWNLTVTIVSCLLFIISAKRCLPEFSINFRFPRETVVIVLKFSAGVIGHQILSNIFILFERSWITRNFGAENLTYYVVPMSLAIYIHGFISSIILVVFPLVSELKSQPNKLLRLYLKATKIVCFFVVFLGITIVVQSRDFLTLWMGAAFADKSYLILIIHAVGFCLLATITVSWSMTEGLGYPQFNTLIFGASLVINVILIFTLSENYGNVGIAAARSAGFAFLYLTVFYVERWFLGRIQIGFWLRLAAQIGTAAIASVIVQEIVGYYFPLNWFRLTGAVAGGGIVYCLLLFLLGYIAEDEKILITNLFKRS